MNRWNLNDNDGHTKELKAGKSARKCNKSLAELREGMIVMHAGVIEDARGGFESV